MQKRKRNSTYIFEELQDFQNMLRTSFQIQKELNPTLYPSPLQLHPNIPNSQRWQVKTIRSLNLTFGEMNPISIILNPYKTKDFKIILAAKSEYRLKKRWERLQVHLILVRWLQFPSYFNETPMSILFQWVGSNVHLISKKKLAPMSILSAVKK